MCVNQEQTSLSLPLSLFSTTTIYRYTDKRLLVRVLAYSFVAHIHLFNNNDNSLTRYYLDTHFLLPSSFIITYIHLSEVHAQDKQQQDATMNCSVYTSSFLPYRTASSHQSSSFRIDDILKPPSTVSPPTGLVDPTALWSSFAAQLLAYSPELLSLTTAAAANAAAAAAATATHQVSPPLPNLISPSKHHHHHHRHQYHPYLSSTRHSPTGKLQHDPTSMLTISTNKNNYQHTLSPLSIKDKLQHPHIDRKGMFKQR